MQVWVVEDHSGVRAGLEICLESEGHDVRLFCSCAAAWEAWSSGIDADLVLLDLGTPGPISATELVNRIKRLAPGQGRVAPRFCLMSGNPNLQEMADGMNLPLRLQKPFTLTELGPILNAQ